MWVIYRLIFTAKMNPSGLWSSQLLTAAGEASR